MVLHICWKKISNKHIDKRSCFLYRYIIWLMIMHISILHAAAAAAKSFQSCPTLCDPIDSSPPGSSVHGIFQARVLEWGAIAFSSILHTSVFMACLPGLHPPPGPRPPSRRASLSLRLSSARRSRSFCSRCSFCCSRILRSRSRFLSNCSRRSLEQEDATSFLTPETGSFLFGPQCFLGHL